MTPREYESQRQDYILEKLSRELGMPRQQLDALQSVPSKHSTTTEIGRPGCSTSPTGVRTAVEDETMILAR